MVTIDQVVDILAQTVFSVKGACGLAIATIMNKDFYSGRPFMFAWLVLVVVFRLLAVVNRGLADQPKKWTPPAPKDIIVVTGAASGLGLLVSGILSERGLEVVAVDCKKLPIGLAQSEQFELDIADQVAVDTMAAKVLEMGTPKAIVHCAGVVRGGKLDSLQPEDIRLMVDVNYLGNLWITKAFMGPMMQRDGGSMILSIASSTALAAPAGAGVYAATKAALRANHEALRYETAKSNLRTLLVTPGQLDTAMFANVQNPAPRMAPTLRGVDLAVDIVDAIYAGRTGEIRKPFYAQILPAVSLLPQSLIDFLRGFVGIDCAMDTAA